MIVPATLTRDLSRFDCCDFTEIPKWVIMRNETGLQVQLFWEAKKPLEKNSTTKSSTPPKRSKRKRSPQKIVQSPCELSPSRQPPENDEPSDSMNDLSSDILTQLNKWQSDIIDPASNDIQRQLGSLINLDRSPTLENNRARSRRSPAPRFYPLTDPVVKFLQETLVEDSQGRVACSDLSDLSARKFGNPINMVSMGMKLRFLYPNVTRVKINNRAFYTNVAVRTSNDNDEDPGSIPKI